MNKKIKAVILFSLIVSFMGISSISFSGDDFEEGGFHHWQKRLIESRDSKNVVLLEMLGEAARESDGFTFRILQPHGPSLFYGDTPNNKRDFQRLLLNIFKTYDLPKFKSFYGIKDGESDLHVARVFQTVFYLYAVETGFTYRLRENLKETLSWSWSDSASPELLLEIVKSMDELVGPKISYHIRARIKNLQSVGGIEEVVVVVQWELSEVESSYNPQKDALETAEKEIEKSAPIKEFLSKKEAGRIEGDYGTKTGISLESEAVITLFQKLAKTSNIRENPAPYEIGAENWGFLEPFSLRCQKKMLPLSGKKLIDYLSVTNKEFVNFLNLYRINKNLSAAEIFSDLHLNKDDRISYDDVSNKFVTQKELENKPALVNWWAANAYANFFGLRLPSSDEWLMGKEIMRWRETDDYDWEWTGTAFSRDQIPSTYTPREFCITSFGRLNNNGYGNPAWGSCNLMFRCVKD